MTSVMPTGEAELERESLAFRKKHLPVTSRLHIINKKILFPVAKGGKI